MCCKQLADALEEKSRRVVMRCGGLNPADWPALLDSASVLCMTPQTLDNMFKQCAASWDQFDLLVSATQHCVVPGISGSPECAFRRCCRHHSAMAAWAACL